VHLEVDEIIENRSQAGEERRSWMVGGGPAGALDGGVRPAPSGR